MTWTKKYSIVKYVDTGPEKAYFVIRMGWVFETIRRMSGMQGTP